MSDTFKVDIIDYQNIKKVSMEIDKGLTVIIGRTNEGKSSTVRAIHDAIFNTGSDEDVRAGKKQYLVRIDNGRGNLIYKRSNVGKNQKSAYQLNNGDVLTKIGRSQLQEVYDLLNITEVKMKNNQKEKINFWFQEERPFLTNATDSQLFEFLSLTSSEQYIKVLRQIKQDISEVNTDIMTTSSSIDALNDLNVKYKEFIDNNEGYQDLYERIVVFGDNTRKFSEIENAVSNIESRGVKLNTKKALYDKVVSHVNRFDFNKIDSDYNNLSSLNESVLSVGKLISVIENKNNRISKSKHKLSKVKIAHDNIDADAFKDSIRIVEEESNHLKELEGFFRSIKTINDKLKNKQNDYSNAVSNYDLIIEEVSELEEELGYCPLCGSEFDKS